ncbi:alpha/beta hydrolase [Paraburkholderia azotifigens]|uniref:Alpha/beta fold hydrolase n=2 Tax=Paraburkholderia azotifigens TaxID=2057004 RepID=A0ABU9R091_9BURK
MVQRLNVEIEAEGGIKLRAWLFMPDARKGLLSAISMAHGYAGTREHGLERFAHAFASAGFIVLLHDHRGFGSSEGEPRHDVDPWRQIADWRRAISFLESCEGVDPARIGLWGTSFAGGHAIVLGATDRRLRCVVAQVPTLSGYEQGLRRIPPESVSSLEEAFANDERAQAHGEPPMRQAIVGDDPNVPAAYRTMDAMDFYLQPVSQGMWENTVTLRSIRLARMYEPGIWISRVSPTPLLMIVALQDTITVTDLALGAYERALQPKRLVTFPGGHFDGYEKYFQQTSGAAVDWFREQLS